MRTAERVPAYASFCATAAPTTTASTDPNVVVDSGSPVLPVPHHASDSYADELILVTPKST
jgi:hypothetical protein